MSTQLDYIHILCNKVSGHLCTLNDEACMYSNYFLCPGHIT